MTIPEEIARREERVAALKAARAEMERMYAEAPPSEAKNPKTLKNCHFNNEVVQKLKFPNDANN
jgi:hypothetical protein